MRRFVLVARTATARADFSLDDLPSTSGRLDLLLRAVRAALLISHGLRAGVEVYLVLGGNGGPRVLRISADGAKFLRPDERSLAILVKKALGEDGEDAADGSFREVRPGVWRSRADLPHLLARIGDEPCYLLSEAGSDIRREPLATDDAWFFIGDHLGFDAATLALLEAKAARPLAVGPLSLHSEDVVVLINNELDRRRVGG